MPNPDLERLHREENEISHEIRRELRDVVGLTEFEKAIVYALRLLPRSKFKRMEEVSRDGWHFIIQMPDESTVEACITFDKPAPALVLRFR